MHFLQLTIASLLAAGGAATAAKSTSPNERGSLNAVQANQILAAASKKAQDMGVPEVIVVVDPSAYPIALVRNDNAYLGSIDVAMKTSKTVALFSGTMSSEKFGSLIKPDSPDFGLDNSNGGLLGTGGGMPVFVDGVFMGAVGASGGTVAQDVEIATAGVQAIGTINGTISPF